MDINSNRGKCSNCRFVRQVLQTTPEATCIKSYQLNTVGPATDSIEKPLGKPVHAGLSNTSEAHSGERSLD